MLLLPLAELPIGTQLGAASICERACGAIVSTPVRDRAAARAAQLFAATLLPFIYRMSGWLYLAAAVVLGAMFIGYAWRLWRAYSEALARRPFRFSIVHLSLLFAALLLDHYLMPLLS